MNEQLLTPGEARLRLGLSRSTFHRLQQRGKFKPCLAKMPLGRRKYIPALIAKLGKGESIHEVRRASR